MSEHPLRLYDRSRTTTDWTCRRKRYWNYEYARKGVVPGTLAIELYLGSCLHDGLAAIATTHRDLDQVPIDDIARAAYAQVYGALKAHTIDEPEEESERWAQEQGTLVEGLLRGFYRHTWPQLIQTYPIIRAIEQEMVYVHDGLTFMAKPDLILENADGLFYLEYKSTSSKKDGWIQSWNTAVQLHSTIRAVESTLGEKVTGVIVQGLYKGYEAYNKQTSPFCYAYFKGGQPPFSTSEVFYEWKPGSRKTPVWELAGGCKSWVESMPSSILMEQFPQTPPIYIKDALVDAFFAQTQVREKEIELAFSLMDVTYEDPQEAQEVQEYILHTSFPQSFDQCHPGWGKPCSYKTLCHGPQNIDPLALGYTWRVPHHTPEMTAWEEATHGKNT